MPDFATPLALLLLPLGLLARFLPKARPQLSVALYTPPTIAGWLVEHGGNARAKRIGIVLAGLLWSLVVIAVAGPRTPNESVALPVSGRDMVIALDLSGSMRDVDFELDGRPVSRLDAVKNVAGEIVESRGGDRIGLVVFADRPYFAAPLTFDNAALAQAIYRVTIGISGDSTAIADGVGLALRRLERSQARSRAVILLSDGADNASTVVPAEVGDLARRLGVKIYSVAIGPHDMASNPDDNDAVDTETLGAIAAASGGKLFRVKTLADLQDFKRELDLLEPSLVAAPPIRTWRDLWPYPACLALILAVVLAFRQGAVFGER